MPAPRNSTLLCTSITAETMSGALAEIEEAHDAGATAIELRLDFLRGFGGEADLKRLLDASKLPVIVTCRPTWEGGRYSGGEGERLLILQQAARLGADYVDVELKVAGSFFAGGSGTKVIVSSHNYERTPEDSELQQLQNEIFNFDGTAVGKIAAVATDISDAERLLSLLDSPGRPMIALAMGERGQLARLLAAKRGGVLTFGALKAGKESAPGQPTIQHLRKLYRLDQHGPDTKFFGIIGNPVGHSLSPLLHNSAFSTAGLDCCYVPLLVDDAKHFLAGQGHQFAGFSVTIPHKIAAMEAADEVDPVAQQIGAVNTLVRQPDGRLKGFNTDWSAAISAIEAGLREPGAASQVESPLKGKTVVIIGAGGAGRALVFGAAHAGAHVIIANRSRQKAEHLAAAAEGRAQVADLQALLSGQVQGHVLVNTTSIGMHPDEGRSPMGLADLSSFEVVFDAVYVPMETQLLKAAKQAGCTVVNGLEMFVGQAMQQFELFTGQPAPADLMHEVALRALSNKS
eukprot:jgi/Astpho2/291/fgenesh1_pm.00010_%23_22_t